MSVQKFSIAATALSLVICASANADVLKLPGATPQVVTIANSPVRGMTKAQVESQFGAPRTKAGPVGIPAIYRWDYSDYSVFFENNHVLHAVVTAEQ